MKGLALFGLALAAPASAQAPPPHIEDKSPAAKDREIRSLAVNLDNVIKACSAISVRGGSADKSIRRPEQAAIDRGLLTYSTDIPPNIVAASNPRFGKFRFGKWFDPHAQILILAYETTPLCLVLVGQSQWVQEARPELYALIQNDNFWKPSKIDQLTSESDGSFLHTVFIADTGNSSQPTISIMANTGPEKDGNAQLTMTVSLISKGQ
ncbi:hypothetical protein WG908_02405 [Sphingobium sp. AN641]|uniref:hypothetical protein n=1 Tax=Sphingobium sp. AN641 TaxID=3133443 RepID=UPI0030BCC5C0